jgi:IclR family acetate operon transcriptional repressor
MSTDVEGAGSRRARRRAELASPKVLERTFAVLSLFTADGPEWTTAQIGRACNLPLPTAHRILAALQGHHYIVRDKISKRFRLGPAALALGRNAEASLDLRTLSLPVLQRISARTGETSLLSVPSEDRLHSICVERVESPQALRLSMEPGRTFPLHAGAQQKALLAFLPTADLERVLAGPLEKLCRATIDDPEQLREELRSIRQSGWASSYDETNLGVWGISITLLDEHDHPVASLGLAGPEERRSDALTANWLELLQAGVAELASNLGLRSSRPGGRSRSSRDVH